MEETDGEKVVGRHWIALILCAGLVISSCGEDSVWERSKPAWEDARAAAPGLVNPGFLRDHLETFFGKSTYVDVSGNVFYRLEGKDFDGTDLEGYPEVAFLVFQFDSPSNDAVISCQILDSDSGVLRKYLFPLKVKPRPLTIPDALR